MESKDVTIKLADEQPTPGCNVYFTMLCPGFSGLFRIHFSDESRKNSSYKKIVAEEVYWEGSISERSFNTFTCYRAIEALLFATEKKQWILEQLKR